jgi:hypothetical protein
MFGGVLAMAKATLSHDRSQTLLARIGLMQSQSPTKFANVQS